ncbi:MAG: polysaccharide deacetylase family protein [Campylobacterales bacterium]|nr:polysaccharide deacetylase family protein [Campylobacterales bacterium]
MDKIPNRSFAITFDDGFEDNYINAFPILQKYNFKATVYLVPNLEYNSWEGKKPLLKIKQIIEMQNSRLVEFGSHTKLHKNLLTLRDDQVISEVEESKKEIEGITKKECKSFAYPYGKFNENIIKIVKNAGYISAVTVKRGLFSKDDESFSVKRIGILGTESFFDFYLKVTRIRNKL